MLHKTSKHPLAIAFEILKSLGDAGRYVWATQEAMGNSVKHKRSMAYRVKYVQEAIAWLKSQMKHQGKLYRELPVDFKTFVQCPMLLNKLGTLWEPVLDVGQEINNGRYVECVLTGGIGVAKTTLAIYTQAYQTYLLSCMVNPHETFDLDPASEIVIVFQSKNKGLAEEVGYDRFRAMIDGSPYFQTEFTYNTELKTSMKFDRFRIVVKPVSGADTAAIGQNVIGGIIDEVNFMDVVENSKQSKDGTTYDQAMQNYSSIATRRNSRFMQLGTLPGMLCLVSSRNYPGQFTDIKEAEARSNPRIYVYDKRLWEIRPERYCFHTGVRTDEMIEQLGPNFPFWFRVFIGDATRRPRILDDTDEVGEQDAELVMQIPIEHRESFVNDITRSLRDIAGVATLALHPFMLDTEKVIACFGRVQSIASRTECDFQSTKIDIYPKRFRNLEEPRFVHIDLAESKDSCGFTVGHVSGFQKMNRGTHFEFLPVIEFDLVLEIRPPRGGEIIFENTRKLLYLLRTLGMKIKWVTFDSYQSTDSLQILSNNGFTTGYQSMDTDTIAYDVTKTAFYDGRIKAPSHALAQQEMITLEYNVKEKKIDHTPTGSKDVADSMAGVIYGLTMRREIWTRHGISLNSIPKSLTETESQGKKSLSYKEILREQRRDKKKAA